MSVLTALVAGVLGLAAGLTLERFRRSSTDRRWLLDHRPPGGGDLRFDVVSIVRQRGSAPRLHHLRGAL